MTTSGIDNFRPLEYVLLCLGLEQSEEHLDHLVSPRSSYETEGPILAQVLCCHSSSTGWYLNGQTLCSLGSTSMRLFFAGLPFSDNAFLFLWTLLEGGSFTFPELEGMLFLALGSIVPLLGLPFLAFGSSCSVLPVSLRLEASAAFHTMGGPPCMLLLIG